MTKFLSAATLAASVALSACPTLACSLTAQEIDGRIKAQFAAAIKPGATYADALAVHDTIETLSVQCSEKIFDTHLLEWDSRYSKIVDKGINWAPLNSRNEYQIPDWANRWQPRLAAAHEVCEASDNNKFATQPKTVVIPGDDETAWAIRLDNACSAIETRYSSAVYAVAFNWDAANRPDDVQWALAGSGIGQ